MSIAREVEIVVRAIEIIRPKECPHVLNGVSSFKGLKCQDCGLDARDWFRGFRGYLNDGMAYVARRVYPARAKQIAQREQKLIGVSNGH